MYADRIAAGSKRSVMDRLNGGSDHDYGHSNPGIIKRQRQSDNKWEHDFFAVDRDYPEPKPRVGPKDLRLKLQKKVSQQGHHDGNRLGVRDLREKLSGTMNPQLSNTKVSKSTVASEISKVIRKNIPSVEAALPDTKTSVPASTQKKSQQKSALPIDSFLQSLGLEKYSMTFQVEEVDMTALKHMSDEDMKALGIPMGPRRKILLALKSRGKD